MSPARQNKRVSSLLFFLLGLMPSFLAQAASPLASLGFACSNFAKKNKRLFAVQFRIRTFPFRSYSFGIETVNTFIHSRSSLENHTRFQTKMGKVYITRFQTQKGPKTIPFGAVHTYRIYSNRRRPQIDAALETQNINRRRPRCGVYLRK